MAGCRRFCVVGVVAAAVTAWVAVAVVAAAPAVAQSAGFDDVAEDAYYSVPVAALAERGIFAGTECAQGFCPNDPIDRKTMAVWMVRVLDGEDPPALSESRFDDVDAHSFHAPLIERMAELGVTRGCGDGSGFCPDRVVSRAQMAVFLTSAFGLPAGPDPGFLDVPGDAWYAAEVASLAASGITLGCGDGTVFCPERDTSRAHMATFIHRALNPASTSVGVEGPRVEPRGGTETELVAFFEDVIGVGETRAYDFGIRTKVPRGRWIEGCAAFSNTSGQAVTATFEQGFSGLEPGTVYEVRYRYRNSSQCGGGSPSEWSSIGEGSTGDDEPGRPMAPADAATFDTRAVGGRLIAEDSGFFIDFTSNGRIVESGRFPGSYRYSPMGPNSGTLTLTYDGGEYGGTCTISLTFGSATTGTLEYTCASGVQGLSNWQIELVNSTSVGVEGPRVEPRGGTETELVAFFEDVIGVGETRAYDFGIRTKVPRGRWIEGCAAFSNTSGQAVTATFEQGFSGLEPGTVYEVRYRYRNSSQCGGGSPSEWSSIGEGSTGDDEPGHLSGAFGAGDTIPGFPSGFGALSGNFRNGVQVSASGGVVTITMSNGGTAEYSHATYTCASAGGCVIENGRVARGTVTASDAS